MAPSRILAAWLGLLCASACHKAADSFHVTSELEPKPAKVGAVSLSLRVRDAAGQLVSGARMELEGNMAHAGMAPVFGAVSETGPGTYKGVLHFSMAGDWVILIHGKLPGGTALERQISVRGVRE